MTHFKKMISTALILVLISCNDTDQVDLIIHNAKIYTVNDQFDIEEAMAIKDGKILAIGPEHEILNKYSALEIIDAKQQSIFPGFIDAHCHFLNYGFGKKNVDLVGTKSFNEVVERVKEFSIKK